MNAFKIGSIGGTYSGNAVCYDAANAVIDIFHDEPILDNVNRRGEQLRERLGELAQIYPIADVRSRGLMNAIEFKQHDNMNDVAAHISAQCD